MACAWEEGVYVYVFKRRNHLGPSTALHLFQKRFAPGTASLCTNFSQLIVRGEPNQAVVDRFHLLCTGLVLAILASCLPLALSGCGGAFLSPADGAAQQASVSNEQFGTASAGQIADSNASIVNQGSAQLEPSRLDAVKPSSSMNAQNNASVPVASDSGTPRLATQFAPAPAGYLQHLPDRRRVQ
jgi:hypothetical protein